MQIYRQIHIYPSLVIQSYNHISIIDRKAYLMLNSRQNYKLSSLDIQGYILMLDYNIDKRKF